MEEKGSYKSYEGRVILCENQQWMLDKVLMKIIIDIFNNKFESIPNIRMSTSTSINIPYRAPFKQNKRFPESGKYARIGVGSVWFTLFSVLIKIKNEVSNSLFQREIEVPRMVVGEMMEKFYEEEDMFNRESFEKTMNIQWNNTDTSKTS